jgi:hypothetical protein
LLLLLLLLPFFLLAFRGTSARVLAGSMPLAVARHVAKPGKRSSKVAEAML